MDGYAVRRVLGSGSVGSVWLAQDLGSGRPVVVKRIPAALVPSTERFRRDVALAQGLDHPHLARLLEVRQAEREYLFVSEYAAAGSLAALLQRRGPLSLGELVTLIGPIAQALAAAHRAGLTHSHLGAGDIVFTPNGRPLLTDLGLRSTTADATDRGPRPTTAGTAAAFRPAEGDAGGDLGALAELAVSAGGDPDVFSVAAFGTDAAAAAQRVLSLTTPEPINLAFGDDPAVLPPGLVRSPSPISTRPTLAWWNRAPRRPRAAPGVLLSVGLAVVVVLAIGAALIARLDHQPTSAGSSPPTTAPSASPTAVHPSTVSTPTPPPATPRSVPPTVARPVPPTVARPVGADAWLATLRALDVRRSRAFATLDEHQLDRIYVPGSQPWRSDRWLLASYSGRSLRVQGLSIRIERVTVARPGRQEVVLHVVDRLVGATAIDAAGHRTALPPGRAMSRLITLTNAGDGTTWRITRIVAA